MRRSFAPPRRRLLPIALMTFLFFASITVSQEPAFRKINEPALPNAHWVTEKVLSGGQPEGEAGFAALARLGVRTIISVDGASPDLANARKYDLRYVHLPIGYSGVLIDQGKAIAKAIDELPGPIYLHCHHGKHRSAAAVAVACVMNGTLKSKNAESVLKTFGTGEGYKGLWKSAREARALDAAELAAIKVNYVEQAKLPPLAEAMVEIEHRWERMISIHDAQWRPPANHPDLDPPHEALQLQELFHEMARSEPMKEKSKDFLRIMEQSEAALIELGESLRANPIDASRAEKAYDRVARDCKGCHNRHRDAGEE